MIWLSFEVAAAHVSIFPKFATGFGRQLRGQMNAEGGAAGREGGRATGVGFMSVLKGVLGAQAISGVLGGVKNAISGAFKGGFDRLMNIEQAQIKLRTLGLDVEKSMASVSAAVDGTKFAISDAADMAATLGASGVDAGDEMTRWLTLTADAAQFLNRDFGDVQRNIQKIVAEGRVTGETFQEIPLAAAALADYLGVSQEEVRKLASQGKISSDEFAAAMEAKIGGAAKNAGESFLSLAANIRTAMNASGANLLEPITKALMPIMAVGLDLVKQFRDEVAKPLGASLGDWLIPKAEALAGVLTQLPDAISGIVSLVRDGDFTGGIFGIQEDSPIVGIILGIRDAIQLVMPLFQQWAGNQGALLGGVAAALLPVFSQLPSMLAPLVPVLQTILSTAGGLIGELLPPLAGVIQAILPPLMQMVATVLPPLAGLFAQLATAVAPLIMQLVTGLAPILIELVTGLIPPLTQVFMAVIPVVSQLIAAIAPLISMLLAELIPIIAMLAPHVTKVFELIANVISTAMDVISSVISAVMAAINGDWDAAWGHLADAAKGIIEGLGPAISDLLGKVGEMAFEGAKAIGQMLIDGLMSMVGGIGDAVGSLVGKIADFLPHSPAKTGPFSGAGWGGWGEAIGDRLADELNGRVSLVGRAAHELASAAVPSGGTGGGGRGVGSGVTNIEQQNVIYTENPIATGRYLARELLRAAG